MSLRDFKWWIRLEGAESATSWRSPGEVRRMRLSGCVRGSFLALVELAALCIWGRHVISMRR